MKLSTRRQGFTLVEIMIVVVIIGLLAAMAIPAFQKVRATSRAKTIENNIRQVASGADQYFVETGLSTVAVASLIGPTNYIKNPIESVAQETYPTTVTTGMTFSMSWNGATGSVSKSWSF
jgi:type IV pilus assembly protein PilA